MNDPLIYLLWIAATFSIVLSALGVRDYLLKKGLWVTDTEESATFRIVFSLLYDAEERIKEHMTEAKHRLKTEHRIALIDELNKLKKLIEDDK